MSKESRPLEGTKENEEHRVEREKTLWTGKEIKGR